MKTKTKIKIEPRIENRDLSRAELLAIVGKRVFRFDGQAVQQPQLFGLLYGPSFENVTIELSDEPRSKPNILPTKDQAAAAVGILTGYKVSLALRDESIDRRGRFYGTDQ